MIADLVTSYGYLAVFVGTLLEGETALIAAGFAAHNGLLEFPLVLLLAIAGGTMGDQLAFLLGRWRGAALRARFPSLAKRQPRIHTLLERYDALFIGSVRFLFGLRIARPVIMGSSPITPLRFAVFNVIGAVLWAALVAGAGYTFGRSNQKVQELLAGTNDAAITLVHLIHRHKGYETQTKDYEFSRDSMHEHWSVGLSDMSNSLRMLSAAAPSPGSESFRVFDYDPRSHGAGSE